MRSMAAARDSEQTSSPGEPRHASAPTRPPTDAARLQHALGNRVVQRLLRAVHADPSPAAIHQAAAAGLHSPAAPLPHRDRIQAAFGRHPLAGVRAHLGPDAAASGPREKSPKGMFISSTNHLNAGGMNSPKGTR